MKNNEQTTRAWRVVIIALALIYVVTVVLFTYTVNNVPGEYTKAQVVDNNKIKNKITAVLDNPTKEDFENLEIRNNIEFVVSKDNKIIYSSLPLNGVLEYKQLTYDNKLASESFFEHQGYKVWFINYYVSPQKVFDNWIVIMFGLLIFMISVVLIIIIIVYSKFIYPFKRLKDNIGRLKNHQFKLDNKEKATEYDALSKELYQFARELDSYLKKSTITYTALESKLLQNNDQLEYKNKIISGMTHDLKAPLNVIKLLSEELKLENDLEKVATIEKTVQNAIEDINEISRFAYNDDSLNKVESIDLIKELMDIYKQYIIVFNSKKLNVTLDLDASIEVELNKINYKQLVNNALSNIGNYALDNGEVIISCYQEENKIFLKFYNDAKQLSKEQIKDIFELYYRISDDGIGSGTGLYTIKSIADKMAAEVCFKNKNNGVELEIILRRE